MWRWDPTVRIGGPSRLYTTGEGAVDGLSMLGGAGFPSQQPQQGVVLPRISLDILF